MEDTYFDKLAESSYLNPADQEALRNLFRSLDESTLREIENNPETYGMITQYYKEFRIERTLSAMTGRNVRRKQMPYVKS